MSKVTQVESIDDPDELEAEGHEEIASGNQKIARAKRLRVGRRDAPDDQIVTVDDWESLGFRSRRSCEDNFREKIASFRAGAKRCAFRKDVIAFFTTHKLPPKPIVADGSGDAADDYLTLVGAK